LASSPRQRELIELARIIGAWGVRGWVKAEPLSEALAACKVWTIGGRDWPVEEAKEHSGTLLAKLRGIEDREQAAKLKGRPIAVERSALPEPAQGTYYFADLVGLEVVNTEGRVLGTVRGMFSNGAHDVAEVAGGRTRLLPWVPAVVKRVDLAARRIEVEWGADW